ncbi:hypothetical protein EVAR_39130_1 [Eumeta japonica]|uniref:Uncharacterized protein n=1 Tax=Eumeta variegata TaxID=151549 RepID=A0A4C2AAS3_EUMVA|nr:hypothetical protein EVAR_39130_1 [Eumeta japonica]
MFMYPWKGVLDGSSSTNSRITPSLVVPKFLLALPVLPFYDCAAEGFNQPIAPPRSTKRAAHKSHPYCKPLKSSIDHHIRLRQLLDHHDVMSRSKSAYKVHMATAVRGHSQPPKSHQCGVGYSVGNGISIKEVK